MLTITKEHRNDTQFFFVIDMYIYKRMLIFGVRELKEKQFYNLWLELK
jgi:hypothetical protein